MYIQLTTAACAAALLPLAALAQTTAAPAPVVTEADHRSMAIAKITFLAALFFLVVAGSVCHSLRKSAALRPALLVGSDDEEDLEDRRTWRNPVTNHVLEDSDDGDEEGSEEGSGEEGDGEAEESSSGIAEEEEEEE
jgi:hypothetical protein